MHPLFLLGLFGAAMFALSRILGDEDQQSSETAEKPEDRWKKRPLVKFTTRDVFWKTISDKKTKEPIDLYRVEVVEEPAALCKAFSQAWGKITGKPQKISPNAFVLGTMIASEAGDLHPLAKVAVAHTAVNMARSKKMRLTKLLTPDGKFGSQQGRYASTRKPGTIETIEIAQAVLEGKIKDPTGGALQFDSPTAQKAGVKSGWAGYHSTPEEIAKDRMGSGKIPVYLPGIEPEKVRFWRPVSEPVMIAMSDLPDRW